MEAHCFPQETVVSTGFCTNLQMNRRINLTIGNSTFLIIPDSQIDLLNNVPLAMTARTIVAILLLRQTTDIVMNVAVTPEAVAEGVRLVVEVATILTGRRDQLGSNGPDWRIIMVLP